MPKAKPPCHTTRATSDGSSHLQVVLSSVPAPSKRLPPVCSRHYLPVGHRRGDTGGIRADQNQPASAAKRLGDRGGVTKATEPGWRRVLATAREWSKGYAQQAAADLNTFETLQSLEQLPECHKLQFLQTACEKLAKAHLCDQGTDPAASQKSHSYVAKTLPVVLRNYAKRVNFKGQPARQVLKQARTLCQEIDVLAPAVKRGGDRPDNCEYPWADDLGRLHLPLG